MKFAIINIVLIIMSFMEVHGYPPFLGQPGCQTDEELDVKYYRYLNNKTLYWKCVEKGKPAIVERCPHGMGFLEPERQCVAFSRWYYTPPFQAPLSTANWNYELYGPYYHGPYGPHKPYGRYYHGSYIPYN